MRLLLGDCLDKLKELEDNSVDSIVTDPPYGLSFMGKKWDYDVPTQEIWQECLRVLKHGGHLLAFAGSRTYHRMAVRIEDAGFEIRDQIMWIYGSGFPKSHNIGKAVDKLQGNERIPYERPDFVARSNKTKQRDSQVPSGEKGKYTKGNSPYEGWGTALKPAHEPIVMARKPLSEKTVVENVLEWGTGGINIDDSRIQHDEPVKTTTRTEKGNVFNDKNSGLRNNPSNMASADPKGRFPANVIFDKEAGKILDEQSESASRFFYCPKTSKKDRNEGLEHFEAKPMAWGNQAKAELKRGNLEFSGSGDGTKHNKVSMRVNTHPTVKPTDLMLYLIRLVTPKDGITLDPFMGSGSTGKAALKGGFDFIGIEREQEYFDIAKARIDHENNNLFKK